MRLSAMLVTGKLFSCKKVAASTALRNTGEYREVFILWAEVG